MALSILIKDNLDVVISVDGIVIGMVQSLELKLDVNEVLPKVQIVLPSVQTLDDEMAKEHVLRALNNYKTVLLSQPFVRVYADGDTVPEMSAVIPEGT